jgi:hypothetical protein
LCKFSERPPSDDVFRKECKSARQQGAPAHGSFRKVAGAVSATNFSSSIQEGEGLTRGEILEKMGLKGNKSGEMSVSNSLTALTKSNQVRRGENRKYVAA